MKAVLVAALAAFAYPAAAQEAPPLLQSVLDGIDGQEVSVSGSIWVQSREFMLATDYGAFVVDFAVGRETLARLRECPPTMFQPQACQVSALGELHIVNGYPTLTLFHVEFAE